MNQPPPPHDPRYPPSPFPAAPFPQQYPPYAPYPSAGGQPTPSDLEHLKYLVIGYYIATGLSAIFALFPVLHVVMGLAMVTGRLPGSGPSVEMGWVFVGIGGAFILFGLTMAVMNFLTARFITARENRMFCMVVAAINCLNAPLGTLLGVFTFVVLSRDRVRALFPS